MVTEVNPNFIPVGLEELVGKSFQRALGQPPAGSCQQKTGSAMALSGHGMNTSSGGGSPRAGASVPSAAPQQGEMGTEVSQRCWSRSSAPPRMWFAAFVLTVTRPSSGWHLPRPELLVSRILPQPLGPLLGLFSAAALAFL